MMHLTNWGLWYVVIAMLSWPVIVGMVFHDAQSIWSGSIYRHEYWREDLGLAIAVGTVYAALWPIGLPLTYLLTGFAKHGIIRQK